MRVLKQLLPVLLLVLASAVKVHATHVRAGEITAQRDTANGNQNSLRYIFTFKLYRDTQGVPQESVILDFGDGSTPQEQTDRITRQLGNQTEELIFTFTHTYAAPGAYRISTVIQNRNGSILNLASPSDQISFFVETIILINSTVGVNNTAELLNPPIDLARVGQQFKHNPGAFDADGDSLAYRLVQPRQTSGATAAGYVIPTTIGSGRSEAGGPATLTLDPVRGDLVWDSPARAGEYNVAFVIEEWRAGVKISETTRDMQIIVRDNPNNRPTLVIPNDTCLVAGSLLQGQVSATDPDGNRLRLTSSSGLYLPGFPPQQASFTTPAPLQSSPASGTFSWLTNCAHVREQPYQVLFKAEDLPADTSRKLVDIQVWQIRVVAPAPTGLTAQVQGTQVNLQWDTYTCQGASELLLWRRQGCGEVDSTCAAPLSGQGYVLIARLPASATTYSDSGLEPGVDYSYRLTAGFAPPAGGASLASAEACTSLSLNVPYLVNVSVARTDTATGRILVRWSQPLELDAEQQPGPYRYELYRAEGLSGENFTGPILTRTYPSISANNDTVFVDRSLNTEATAYRYQLRFYSAGALADSSAKASSVRLSAQAQPYAVQLSWQAQVPWSNENQTHRVYRGSGQEPQTYQLVAQVPVQAAGSFTYTDSGLDPDSVYCYVVETQGRYRNTRLPAPLLNFSQVACAQPLDTLSPCPVALQVEGLDCEALAALPPDAACAEQTYSVRVQWQYPFSEAACEQDIVSYQVYYKRYEEDTDFTLLAAVQAPLSEYAHAGLAAPVGCYLVIATDEDGQQGVASDTVCVDTCPYYELPNVLTLNGDGQNEVFRPFACPRFVQAVSFRVHNRWGREVFTSRDDIFLNWNGRLNASEASGSGQELSSGVYYYLAQVQFVRLRRRDEQQQIKGWIHIVK